MKLSSILCISLATALCACSGKSGNKSLATTNKSIENTIEIVNSMRLKSPRRATLFTEEDLVEVVMNPKRKFADIDSVQLWTNNQLVETKYKKPWKWNWKLQGKTMGKQNYQLKAFHEDGTVGLVNSYVYMRSNKAPIDYTYKLINSYPHARKSYTQGLFYKNGFLYEGTGQRGESTLQKVNLKSGKATLVNDLDEKYFGEGITSYQDKIIQLTWQSGDVLIYDINTFEQIDNFSLQSTNGQGWGITTHKKELFISDGSNVITIIDAENYDKKGSIEVYDNNGKVQKLNELEYINGKIYANVWLTDRIVIINPKSGRVEGNIHLNNILSSLDRKNLDEHDDVLNGIAWDEKNNRLFVTGKHWPKLFEIQIEKK